MLWYKRVGNKVYPYWRNFVTGKDEPLTWAQIKRGGDITPADGRFTHEKKDYTYSRMSWEPYFVQPAGRYSNPRNMKPDGSRITDNDWFYQE